MGRSILLQTLSRRTKKVPGFFNQSLCKLGAGASFYLLQFHLLFIVCGQAWIQNILFRKRLRRVRQFLHETGLSDVSNERKFVQFNRVGHAIKHWWFGAFQYFSARDFDRIAKIEGWEHFDHAIKAGKGVIIVHHHIDLVHLAWVLLKRKGFADAMMTIGKEWSVPIAGADNKKKAQNNNSIDHRKFDFLRQLQNAKQTLNRGGVVRILPDGLRGDAKVMTFDFYSRRREFRPGFADLALMTGAAIIPVSVSMSSKGHFTIVFEPELQSTSESNTHTHVAQLMAAYVSYVEEQWRTPALQFIADSAFDNFLELPTSALGESN
jgi:lauroyl/myristoyl acyltransferase